ncbi:hypothetical protein MHYP_G00156400 [Metynnis hypsauchen]
MLPISIPSFGVFISARFPRRRHRAAVGGVSGLGALSAGQHRRPSRLEQLEQQRLLSSVPADSEEPNTSRDAVFGQRNEGKGKEKRGINAVVHFALGIVRRGGTIGLR